MLERIRISTRLVLLVAIVLVISAITGFVGVHGMHTTSRAWSTIFEEDAAALMQLVDVLDSVYQQHNHVVLGMSAQSSGAAETPFKDAEKAVEDVDKAWKSYAATLTPDEQNTATEFASAWAKYLSHSRKTIDLARSGDYEAATEQMKGDGAQSFSDARRALLKLVAQEEAHAKHSRESNAAANEATTFVVVGIFGIGLLLSIVAAWFIIRSITQPLRQIQNCIGDVEKSSDFTRRVPLDSIDEVGSTAASFNALMQAMQSTLHVILDNVAELSNSSHALTTSSEQLAASSVKQAGAAASMAATVEEVTASVAQVSDEAQQAQEISRQAGEISNQGGSIIHEAATTMTKMAETVREASGTIGELGQQSNRISAVVQVIKEVAEQTNLLALNAAIEAARAGEQGRGFAVVADEVRKLAERTTKATEEITQMIGAVQGSARLAVATMNHAVTSVDSGVDLARQAGEAINQIKQGSIHVIEVVSGISSALNLQTHASRELATHVETMTNMCEESSSAADRTANAANTLEKLADTMRAAAGRFRI